MTCRGFPNARKDRISPGDSLRIDKIADGLAKGFLTARKAMYLDNRIKIVDEGFGHPQGQVEHAVFVLLVGVPRLGQVGFYLRATIKTLCGRSRAFSLRA